MIGFLFFPRPFTACRSVPVICCNPPTLFRSNRPDSQYFFSEPPFSEHLESKLIPYFRFVIRKPVETTTIPGGDRPVQMFGAPEMIGSASVRSKPSKNERYARFDDIVCNTNSSLTQVEGTTFHLKIVEKTKHTNTDNRYEQQTACLCTEELFETIAAQCSALSRHYILDELKKSISNTLRWSSVLRGNKRSFNCTINETKNVSTRC